MCAFLLSASLCVLNESVSVCVTQKPAARRGWRRDDSDDVKGSRRRMRTRMRMKRRKKRRWSRKIDKRGNLDKEATTICQLIKRLPVLETIYSFRP